MHHISSFSKSECLLVERWIWIRRWRVWARKARTLSRNCNLVSCSLCTWKIILFCIYNKKAREIWIDVNFLIFFRYVITLNVTADLNRKIYNCKADNGVGSTTHASTILDVHCKFPVHKSFLFAFAVTNWLQSQNFKKEAKFSMIL